MVGVGDANGRCAVKHANDAGETAIKCPECGRVVERATPCVKSLTIPKYHCRCGVSGVLVWRRGEEATLRGGTHKRAATTEK